MTAFSRKAAAAAVLGLAAIPGYSALRSEPAPVPAPGTNARTYRVEVTNLTRGQIFSPAVVATHTDDLPPIFSVGSPASTELSAVAEDAVNQPLMTSLMQSGEVSDIQVITGQNGPILPGESASVVVQGGGRFDRLSLVGMLVTTNDAIYGLSGATLPKKDTVVLHSAGYDAGSEENNELCAFIPGPPCNNPMVRATTNAEGFVHVHAGIHGIGGLDAATFDWRNPVALVRVTRMK